ncbi:hypothetical protein KAI32_02715 [Candidatus Pacearchaeota archaeon]|nr:hypothetical protein [Candidatus Pacearchaeota archaeon]
MPGKNKPKRLDRNRSWRVARRKKKKRDLVSGKSRKRAPRPKKKGILETVKETVKKIIKKKE